MNKKAFALTFTMVMVVAGVVALVALIGAVGGLRPLIEYIAGKSICAAYSVAGAGGTECVHWITLSKDNFTQFKKNIAKKSIDIWHSQPKYKKTAEYFVDNWDSDYDISNDQILYEWMIDEIIAKEIKYCRDLGVLYSFQNWWMGIDELATERNEIGAYEKWFDMVNKPPILCKLCSRIKFSDDLKRKFKDRGEIDSLAGWMKSTPAITGKSYYEYVLFEETGGLIEPQWVYDTNKPYAVIYARVKSSAVNRWIKTGETIMNFFRSEIELSRREKDIHAVLLIPYNEYSEQCDLPI